ncbi:winged helix-turn-helix domain-containing protein [Brucella anthropi]|uniref:Winged helix-turn-helix transcriptional regulator n=1 Tax=Brucella anthropi TaxID=529 RepID=A0A6L3Z4P7_BRUAN|nr:winged helix-turn-helix domain-containing protein [Brucella anthropi]KAB2767625.1 winged helix-turn-helix transcriptional regulator [Brucella anthropi]
MQFDVILPEGMVEVVTNLEATNLPETEIEKLRKAGLSQRDIAFRLDLSQQAVSKHLNSLPPRLTDWPIVGTWDEDDEGESDNQPSLAA